MSDDIVGALKRAACFIEDHYTGVLTDDLRADAKALRALADLLSRRWMIYEGESPATFNDLISCAAAACYDSGRENWEPAFKEVLAALRGEPE